MFKRINIATLVGAFMLVGVSGWAVQAPTLFLDKFSEKFSGKSKCPVGEWCALDEKDQLSYTVTAQVGASIINDFGLDTTVEIILGNYDLVVKLNQDPKYSQGDDKAKIVLIDPKKSNTASETVNVGLSWTDTDLTINVKMKSASNGASSALASSVSYNDSISPGSFNKDLPIKVVVIPQTVSGYTMEIEKFVTGKKLHKDAVNSKFNTQSNSVQLKYNPAN